MNTISKALEKNSNGISVIIPALNEEKHLGDVILEVQKNLTQSGRPFEIIVVDDGSADDTPKIAKEHNTKLIQHPIRSGYGSALRDGIFASKYDWIAIIDADQTYPANRIAELAGHLEKFDMVVGARSGKHFYESLIKYPMRGIFHSVCEFVTGTKIPDVNSGFRAFRKDVVLKFKDNFCLGFSFTTTITLAFHLNGHYVYYLPISYQKRKGRSHVRLLKDTLRTTQIITQAILYYNPIKLFLLLSIITIFASAICFFMSTVTRSALFLSIGQGLLVVSFIYFGLGFIADLIRVKKF
jgi:polyisoprenyl-phosphate glycosyltransferase